MKYLISFFTILFITFTGCSSTHNINNYLSKKNFYDEINKNCLNKETVVLFRNDSSLIVPSGVEIKNDTLFSITPAIVREYRFHALSDLAALQFDSRNATSAFIEYKSGKTITATEVRIAKDSVSFFEVKTLLNQKLLSELTNIRQIGFYDAWSGFRTWSVGGALVGGIIGLSLVKSYSTAHWESQDFMKFPLGAAFGFIVGGIFGYFVDNKITYVIN